MAKVEGQALSDAAEVEARRARRYEPHVEPLNRFTESIGVFQLPLFDPTFGGVNASIAILWESPGPVVESHTGFISPDNPDQSAKNTRLAIEHAQIPREDLVIWNIVPWFLGRASGGTLRKPTKHDFTAAAPFTQKFLELCPNLRVVILGGQAAATGATHLLTQCPNIFDKLFVLQCPHTSPLSINKQKWARRCVWSALEAAKRLA